VVPGPLEAPELGRLRYGRVRRPVRAALAEGLLGRGWRLRGVGLHGRRGVATASSGSASTVTASATPAPTSSGGHIPESLTRSTTTVEMTAAIVDQTTTTAGPNTIPARPRITLPILPQPGRAGAFRAVGFRHLN
jgi:hypothetical protein